MPGKAFVKPESGKALALAKSSAKPRKKRAAQLPSNRLTQKHIHAALLVAQGKTTFEQICKQVNITITQLTKMRTNPLFQAEVEKQVVNFEHSVKGSLLGQRGKRIQQRDAIFTALQHIRKCRAELALDDPELAAQGGKTGLVVPQRVFHKTKHIDTKYAVDHATIDQVRALAKEQAQDVGDMQGDKAGVSVTVVLSQEEQSWL